MKTFPELVTGKAELSDVDLIIRTGGEKRLSDFLLWESAYAELYFTERMWPEFDIPDLDEALASFRARERRFGALPANENLLPDMHRMGTTITVFVCTLVWRAVATVLDLVRHYRSDNEAR